MPGAVVSPQLQPTNCVRLSDDVRAVFRDALADPKLSEFNRNLIETVYAPVIDFGSWSGEFSVSNDGISSNGTTQTNLLLPTGQKVGKQLGIGLSDPCAEPRITNAKKNEDGTFELTFQAENNKEVAVAITLAIIPSSVIDSLSEAVREVFKDTLSKSFLTPFEWQLLTTVYAPLIDTGNWSGEFSVTNDGIRNNGITQRTFLLPIGQKVGKQVGVGLADPCTEPRLTNAKKNKDGTFELTFKAENSRKETVAATVIVIPSSVIDSLSEAVRKVFKDTLSKPFLIPFEWRLLTTVYAPLIDTSSWSGEFSVANDGISSYGLTQKTLLLPTGQKVGKVLGFGLSKPCTEPRITNAKKSEDGTFELTFQAENNKEEAVAIVIIPNSVTDSLSEAVREVFKDTLSKSFLTPFEWRLLTTVYAPLIDTGSWSGEFSVANDGINSCGATQLSLLLPTGQKVGKQVGVGLADPCTEPRLTNAKKNEDGTFELSFQAENNKNETVAAVITLIPNPGIDFLTEAVREVFKEILSKPFLTPFEWQLLTTIYAPLIDTGSWSGEFSVANDGISNYGLTQQILLLPTGQKVGKVLGIGLSCPCTEPRITNAKKSEDGTFELTFQAENNKEEAVAITVAIIPNSVTDSLSEAVREVFKEILSKPFLTPFEWQLLTTIYAPLIDTGNWSGEFSVANDGISSYGLTQLSLLLPTGQKVGKQVGVGLADPCTEPRLTNAKKNKDGTFELTFKAENSRKETVAATVIVIPSSVIDSLSEAVRKVFKDTLSKPFLTPFEWRLLTTVYAPLIDTSSWSGEFSVSNDGISSYGLTQKTLLLPTGQKVGKVIGIGLSKPCTEPRITNAKKNKDGTFELTFKAENSRKETVAATVTLIPNSAIDSLSEAVREVFKETLSKAFLTPFEWRLITTVYAPLIDIGSWSGEFSVSNDGISSYGFTQITLLLPTGYKVGKDVSLKIGAGLSDVKILYGLKLSEGEYVLRVLSYKNDKPYKLRDLLIKGDEITLLDDQPAATNSTLKGFILDSALAMHAPEAITHLRSRYTGVPLTGEVVEPNLSGDSLIIHAKWGTNGADALYYLLRNARLGALRRSEVELIVYDTKYLAELEGAASQLSGSLPLLKLRVRSLHDWCADRSCPQLYSLVAKLDILTKLERTSEVEDIRRGTHPREGLTTIHEKDGSSRFITEGDLSEFVSTLGSDRTRIITLESERVNSRYWEEELHVTQAMILSYLMERYPEEIDIRRIATKLYPPLERYPRAWKALLVYLNKTDFSVSLPDDSEGVGASPVLKEFDLDKILREVTIDPPSSGADKEKPSMNNPHMLISRLYEALRGANPFESIDEALSHFTDVPLNQRECDNFLLELRGLIQIAVAEFGDLNNDLIAALKTTKTILEYDQIVSLLQQLEDLHTITISNQIFQKDELLAKLKKANTEIRSRVGQTRS